VVADDAVTTISSKTLCTGREQRKAAGRQQKNFAERSVIASFRASAGSQTIYEKGVVAMMLFGQRASQERHG
jgi:hypothetical protein